MLFHPHNDFTLDSYVDDSQIYIFSLIFSFLHSIATGYLKKKKNQQHHQKNNTVFLSHYFLVSYIIIIHITGKYEKAAALKSINV